MIQTIKSIFDSFFPPLKLMSCQWIVHKIDAEVKILTQPFICMRTKIYLILIIPSKGKA